MAGTGRVVGMMLAGLTLCCLPVSLVLAGDLAPGQRDRAFKNPDPTPPPPPIVQHYDPAPALWELSDEDTTIYLFGTYHFLPPGFRWRSAQFDRIVAESDELIVETSDSDLSDDDFETAIGEIFGSISDRTPTSEKLSPAASAKWLRMLDQTGMPVEAMDRMPPLLAMMTLGVGFSMGTGSSNDYGVETVLEAEFEKAGKPVGSIEQALPVLTGLLAIDESLLIDQLEDDLAAWDGEDIGSMLSDAEDSPAGSDAEPFAQEHAWAQGEVPGEELFGDTPFETEMSRVLLIDRNRAWAGWLDERLDTPGTVLVAVGAGHFEGEVSVLAMLADRGLVARRIN